MNIPEILEAFDKEFPQTEGNSSKDLFKTPPHPLGFLMAKPEDIKSFLTTHLESYALAQKQELARGAEEALPELEIFDVILDPPGVYIGGYNHARSALRKYFEKEGVLVKEE